MTCFWPCFQNIRPHLGAEESKNKVARICEGSHLREEDSARCQVITKSEKKSRFQVKKPGTPKVASRGFISLAGGDQSDCICTTTSDCITITTRHHAVQQQWFLVMCFQDERVSHKKCIKNMNGNTVGIFVCKANGLPEGKVGRLSEEAILCVIQQATRVRPTTQKV